LVDSSERACKQLLPDLDRKTMARAQIAVASGPHEGDRLRDHMIGGEHMVEEALSSVLIQDLKHAGAVPISFREEREKETGVEEDHFCGSW